MGKRGEDTRFHDSPWTVRTREKRVHEGGGCSHSRRAAMGSGGSAWPHRSDLGQRRASHEYGDKVQDEMTAVQGGLQQVQQRSGAVTGSRTTPQGRGPGCGHPRRGLQGLFLPQTLGSLRSFISVFGSRTEPGWRLMRGCV